MKRTAFCAALLALTAGMIFAGGGQGSKSGQAPSSGGKPGLTLWFGNWWEGKAPGIKASNSKYQKYMVSWRDGRGTI